MSIELFAVGALLGSFNPAADSLLVSDQATPGGTGYRTIQDIIGNGVGGWFIDDQPAAAIGDTTQLLVENGAVLGKITGAALVAYVAATAGVAGADTEVQFNNGGAFGASPNFTWNNGVAPGLTIAGTLAVNVGLAGGNALLITNADPVGQRAISAEGAGDAAVDRLLVAGGTETAPSISFVGDDDTGLFTGTNELAFAAGGARRGRFTTTQFITDVAMYTMDGSAANPQYSFFNDPDSGLYFAAPNSIGIAAGGVQIGFFSRVVDDGRLMICESTGVDCITLAATLGGAATCTTNQALTITSGGTGVSVQSALTVTGQVLASDGALGAPAYAFASDPDTGMYLAAAGSNVLRFGAGGVLYFQIGSSGAIQASLPLTVTNGAAGAPTLAFTNDTDTGLYLPVVGTLGVAVGGVQRMAVSTTAVTATVAIQGVAGGAGSLTYSCATDTDTGWYLDGANLMGWVIGGTEVMTLDSQEWLVSGSGTRYLSFRIDRGALSLSSDTTVADTLGLINASATTTHPVISITNSNRYGALAIQAQGNGGITADSLTTDIGTITTDLNGLNVAATWNNGAVTFTLAELNLVDTASGAASKFIDAMVSGVSKFTVRKDGLIGTASGVMAANINAGFTDGAGASVGTLTNAPAAGDPTKWVPIDDNGTTRYIPAW